MKSCAKILRIVGEADFKSSRGCKKSSSIHKALLIFNRFGGDGRDVKAGGLTDTKNRRVNKLRTSKATGKAFLFCKKSSSVLPRTIFQMMCDIVTKKIAQ